jgi:DNA ligase-1
MVELLERYVFVTMSRVNEKVFPLLLARAKTGKTKYWQVSAYEEDGHAWVAAEYWQDEGQHQVAARKVLGKNIGRSNETTPIQQAVLEAESEWKKQKDKGYHEEGETTDDKYCLPMLAHDYKKRGHNIVYPCWGQPKLDGFR